MTTGCATADHASQKNAKPKVILARNLDSDNTLTSSEKREFRKVLNDARKAEADKYYTDEKTRKNTLKCFDDCGGILVKQGDEIKFMSSHPSYNAEKNTCRCNNQDIKPAIQIETDDAIIAVCRQQCESANRDGKEYDVDIEQSLKDEECICKLKFNNLNNQIFGR